MMFKNIFSTLIALVFFSNLAFAAHIEKNQNLSLEIPNDIFHLIRIETSAKADNIFSVFELGSVEAAKKTGVYYEGAGWIFTVSRLSKDEIYQILQNDTSGIELFAYKGNDYYIYQHPTDVRYMREDNEAMHRDQHIWTKVNDWAYNELRKNFVENNNLIPITENEFKIKNFKGGDKFLGGWHESIAGRGHIYVQKIDGTYRIGIHWSESAFATSFWNMTAKYEDGALVYNDCEYKSVEFSENNGEKVKRSYKNGKGSFKILPMGELVWKDLTGKVAEDSVFLRD